MSSLPDRVGEDDSAYIADSFARFLESLSNSSSSSGGSSSNGGDSSSSSSSSSSSNSGAPFFAQLSFHNCHIPFIGSQEARAACASGKTCKLPAAGQPPYNDAQLDYYACLNELDASVGKVLDSLQQYGYRDNTMVWLTTDNGPEGQCLPRGYCNSTWFEQYPGSAGPLRGRKRDVFEGGHRVPGIISWPSVVKGNRVSNDTLITSDFLPTVMEILGVERPSSQSSWGLDGTSALSFIQGISEMPKRGIGWLFSAGAADVRKANSVAFRHGKWKYVLGSYSCTDKPECSGPMLFDLETDLSESTNLANMQPKVLKEIQGNFTEWLHSVEKSYKIENKCTMDE